MNTRKHLNTIFFFISLFTFLSIIGIIICLIATIAGESAVPLIICAGSAIIFYFSLVILKAFIEIYDATVAQNKIQNAILNNIDEYDTNNTKYKFPKIRR